MKLPVYNRDGQTTGSEIELDPLVFDIEPNEHVMYLAVKVQRARMRQGTHSSKNRSAVRGGGRKPWRQKGRGAARAGTIRSPLWRHGGVVFGPSPHPYKMDIPKKVNRLARRSALADRAQSEAIRLIEDFSFDAPRTKDILNIINSMNLQDEKVLLLTKEYDAALVKSVRNLPKVDVHVAIEASTYDMLNHRMLLIQSGALDSISEVLGGRDRKTEKAA
ncbi:MAG TPA: 50S ribosomal protein L4 [Bacteroidetes bacterium]|nr:50S ribosomal protein L4 [bacterium BMS3Bbin04]HDO66157.1 50S ribosomal protein L4 [Bacteroidota bacterium]HEX05282.1 50S ribosomal protein L4 [Bacteroidota bacterium]